MPVIPFAIQCTIAEHELLALKDSENGCLDTALVSKLPDFEYYFKFYPNGHRDGRRGQVMIFLHLNFGDAEIVEAAYSFLIESAKNSYGTQYTFEKTSEYTGWGHRIAYTEDFFNPQKRFIVDGKCTIKVYGTFKFETNDVGTSDFEEQKWDGGELGNELWRKNDNKDFTISVDGKEIKAHKFILGSRSEIFFSMFKDSKENEVEVKNFSFDVVETAVKMIYNYECATSLSIDDTMSLLHFFDKYNIPSLKDKVEPFLIKQISAATVCRLTNCSIFTNSIQLKKKCMTFLMDSFASKTYLKRIPPIYSKILTKSAQQKNLYFFYVTYVFDYA